MALCSWLAALIGRLSIMSKSFIVLNKVSVSCPFCVKPVENGPWELQFWGFRESV